VHDVNLIGEYNIAGEFWYRRATVRRTRPAHSLGTLSGDARFHEVQTMHRADRRRWWSAPRRCSMWRANSKANYGVPFFEGSFYGITDTSQAFRDFARLSSATPL
jgi:nitrogenase molybdenum-iron protein alpha/beta subunit